MRASSTSTSRAAAPPQASKPTMIAIGKYNTLTVASQRDAEIFLDNGEDGEINLIDPLADHSYQIGEQLQVFVYTDGSGQLFATNKKPYAEVDQVAMLKVVSLSHAGAFVDWGLPKDLLVPFSEQKMPMVEGRSYLIRLFLDETNRIAGSTLLNDFIQDQAFYYKEGQAVAIMIAEPTDLGFKVIVEHKYWGVLYKNEIFQPLRRGQKLTAYVKKLRPDQRLDLILNIDKYGHKVDATSSKVLAILQQHNGYIGLTDKSPPEMIYDTFGISKKIFKQAIGGLYKQRQIIIEDQGIRLNTNAN